MRVAGGVIALISGILGVIAGFYVSFLGGFVTALNGQGAWLGVREGLVGMAFSFLVVAYSVPVFVSGKRWPGCLLIATAIDGVCMGSVVVFFFMAPVMVGGLLALRPRKSGRAAVRRSWEPSIVAAVPLLVVTAICMGSPGGARHAHDGLGSAAAAQNQPARAGTSSASDPGTAGAASTSADPAKSGSTAGAD